MAFTLKLVLFLMGTWNSDPSGCDFAGLKESEIPWQDFWKSDSGFELCMGRHENYPLVIQMRTTTSMSGDFEDLIRDYIDIRMAEVEGEIDHRRWRKLRALLIGSLIDSKKGRLEFRGFRLDRKSWTEIPVGRVQELSLEPGRYEIYFLRSAGEQPLLSERSAGL